MPRPPYLAACVTVLALAAPSRAGADPAKHEGGKAQGRKASQHASAPEKRENKSERKDWCAPEVHELEDHVCFAEGAPPEDGRRTLVVYMHGAYATTPGFAWLQQRAMALHAKRLGFTVLLPTSPRAENAYVWPTSEAAQKEQEASLLAGIKHAREKLEKRVGHGFDEVFVVGFSSGAYYASTAAVRGAMDVDGYVVLAGGSSWARTHAEGQKRAPVFVGVSAADAQTRDHSRAFAGTLGTLGWPSRVEERNAGHEVDWTLLTHGIGWLRAQKKRAGDKP